ncbi:TetR/AcrR family transcriptional regulator [Beijerinckia mobilis]|uniref:TetR/AcrR family transcriptional regulator n=1 Tax=Beijerinckia mobilis TaxID=231434 RepID=UPI00068D3BD6|nr:CerR family C-terminal domain-containing protein [Beijerinckia mobilis]
MSIKLISVSAVAAIRERRSETAARLLEAAGKLFAANGFERTTSAEICRLAKTNNAAVNYYFGSFQELYCATLAEAHSRLMNGDHLSAVAKDPEPASERLRKVIALFLRNATGSAAATWPFRLLGREFLSPSPAFRQLRQEQILPKSDHLRQIIAEILQRPVHDPAVNRGLLCVVSPCLMLLLMDRETLVEVFPGVVEKPVRKAGNEDGGEAEGRQGIEGGEGSETLEETIYRFALAGLGNILPV